MTLALPGEDYTNDWQRTTNWQDQPGVEKNNILPFMSNILNGFGITHERCSHFPFADNPVDISHVADISDI